MSPRDHSGSSEAGIELHPPARPLRQLRGGNRAPPPQLGHHLHLPVPGDLERAIGAPGVQGLDQGEGKRRLCAPGHGRGPAHLDLQPLVDRRLQRHLDPVPSPTPGAHVVPHHLQVGAHFDGTERHGLQLSPSKLPHQVGPPAHLGVPHGESDPSVGDGEGAPRSLWRRSEGDLQVLGAGEESSLHRHHRAIALLFA
ncbi:MAG: hypothetical protein JRI25_10530 [Deltaproteobacteria bacterium]|nr:hypothetical protein [Deltaproteobacteria bacterium]